MAQTARVDRTIANPPIHEPADIAFLCDPARPVLTHGRILAAGGAMRPHHHPRGQLLWAMRGVLRMVSGSCVWIVPPSHAVWIPPDIPHQVFFETEVETRNLYLHPAIEVRESRAAGAGCAVLMLTPLARELILRLGTLDTSRPFDDRLLRFCAVLLDEVRGLDDAGLDLPGGRDPRLMRVTRHLIGHPEDQRSLAELADMAASSPRTLERLFRNETGLSFRKWRSRLRLLRAIEALNQGQTTSAIAWSLGYRSPSAFVAAFREEFGTSPQRFLRA